VDVNWTAVQNWLFNEEAQSDISILKALIRTQVYRPLFFNADDHETFTLDAGEYWCRTQKSHVRFDGEEFPLEFQNGTWNVVPDQSGLDGVDGEYSISDIDFQIDSNSLSYTV
jgi:hypothetical protein